MDNQQEIIDMISLMAEHGHSPKNGCSTFSYGYDNYIEKLKDIYLEKRLAKRGSSAEKFVIGPYGSGKTHFCRQILETGDQIGFVSAEVQLNKNVDFTKPLIVYKELASQIKAPKTNQKGMRFLVENCHNNMKQYLQEKTGDKYEVFLKQWIQNIDSVGLELASFARVTKKALLGYAEGGDENEMFKAACRWLEGDIGNKKVLNLLGESRVKADEEALHGQKSMYSLFQFIRESKYPGTIVLFDESEQSFTVNKHKRQQILSLLQSGINSIADLKNGSVLILYALMLDSALHFNEFAALKQRLDDPIGGKSFFEGNIHAPKILLEYGQELTPRVHLKGIGEKLVELFYGSGINLPVPKNVTMNRIYELVDEISSIDPSPSNRRTMTKSTCYVLMKLYEDGILPTEIPPEKSIEEVE